MYRWAFACFVLCLAAVSATNVKKCSNGEPFPLQVDVVGCDEIPCSVVKGNTQLIKVHFVGTRDNTKEINAVVHATLWGMTVPYPLPDETADVCNNLLYGAMCPIDNTEDVVYNFNFEIDPTFPLISAKVKLNLLDEYNESISCFIVDVKIIKASTAIEVENARE